MDEAITLIIKMALGILGMVAGTILALIAIIFYLILGK